jgi:glycosyltransferase involved in cell wall biosynthesis
MRAVYQRRGKLASAFVTLKRCRKVKSVSIWNNPPMSPTVAIVIPALNEEAALPAVIREIPRQHAPRIVVVDNGSTDRTAEVGREAGAEIVAQEHRGYGRACMAGLARLAIEPPDIVVILDADHSDYPEDLDTILAPIVEGTADLVCGSRVQLAAPDALPLQVRYGNGLATFLIRNLHDFDFADMGPFRAIRWSALESLEMCDPTYGWNAEMQVKALQRGLRVVEVPVRYRRRTGRSKISGTVKGTLLAGGLIVWTIISLRFFPGWQERRREHGSLESVR